jgi:hypothetical protein
LSGNKSFAALVDHVKDQSGTQQVIPVDPRDLGLVPGSPETAKQRPFAAILGCSDARVPIELIFNEGPNDLFVIRVAGNGLGTEVLGSLKYAVENLGGSLKLIVVLGHSGCGALTTAVDMFLNPGNYLPLAAKHSLRNILDRLLLGCKRPQESWLAAFGPDVVLSPGYRKALTEASIVTNAALAAYSIQQEFGAAFQPTCRPLKAFIFWRLARYEHRCYATPSLRAGHRRGRNECGEKVNQFGKHKHCRSPVKFEPLQFRTGACSAGASRDPMRVAPYSRSQPVMRFTAFAYLR